MGSFLASGRLGRSLALPEFRKVVWRSVPVCRGETAMDRDFSQYQIRVPRGRDLQRLHDFLSECFPPDRPVFAEMARSGKGFYTWSPYALYRGSEIVANVSLMPMRIWLEGRVRDVVGVASVATVPGTGGRERPATCSIASCALSTPSGCRACC